MITVTLPDWFAWFIIVAVSIDLLLDVYGLVLRYLIRRQDKIREELQRALERDRARAGWTQNPPPRQP